MGIETGRKFLKHNILYFHLQNTDGLFDVFFRQASEVLADCVRRAVDPANLPGIPRAAEWGYGHGDAAVVVEVEREHSKAFHMPE